jgi:predicted nucleic-acid-binding Zn-ribbon protein
MKCMQCGERTYVVNVINMAGGLRRQRKCKACGAGAYSAEVWLKATANGAEPVYTKEEAALIKKKEVDVRRANEDRRKTDAT